MKGATIVRDARRRAGLTQADLAGRLGTTQSVVARWESGRVSPTLETLRRVVRACGLDLHLTLRPADDHDLGLALQNLRLSPEERLDQLITALRFADDLQRAQ